MTTRSIEEALSTIGRKCRTAATAEEGFRLASELRPGLVITDIHLPDATGFDLCARTPTQSGPFHLAELLRTVKRLTASRS